MQEGFDVEGVSGGWLEDIQQEWPLASEPTKERNDEEGMENGVARGAPSAVGRYEEWVPQASVGLQIAEREGDDTVVEVESEDAQAFLGEQSRVLEAMRAKAAEADRERDAAKGVRKGEEMDVGRGSVVADHIGPVQFNMGGIQVDADDMLQRIKVSPGFPGIYGTLFLRLTGWDRTARSTTRQKTPPRRPPTRGPTPAIARGWRSSSRSSWTGSRPVAPAGARRSNTHSPRHYEYLVRLV